MNPPAKRLNSENIPKAGLAVMPMFLVLLVVFSPVWISGAHDELKGTASLIAAGLLAVVTGIVVLARRELRAGFLKICLFAFALLAWLLAVSLWRGSTLSVLTGVSFETGTFFSLVAFFAALIAGYAFIVSGGRLRALLASIVLSSSVVLLFSGAGILFKQAALVGLFGGWFSTALLFGVSFLILLASAQLASTHKLSAYSAAGAFIFLCAALFVRSGPLLISLGLAGALILFLLGRKPPPNDEGAGTPVSWVAWALVGAALLGGAFSAYEYVPHNAFLDSFGEPRLSFNATAHTILREYQEDKASAFVGSGIGTFGSLWAAYRPRDVNDSPLWNTDFPNGSGLVPTLAGTIGFPLTLALFVILCIALLKSASSMLHFGGALPGSLAVVLSVIIFLTYWSIVYVPNLALFLLIAIFLGVLLGAGEHGKQYETQITFFGDFRIERVWIAAAVSILLIALGAALAGFGSLRALSLFKYYEATDVFAKGPGGDDKTVGILKQSLGYVQLPRTARLLARAYEREARTNTEIARAHPLKPGDTDIALQNARDAVLYGWQAVEGDRTDYRSWLELGNAQALLGIITADRKVLAEGVANYNSAQFRAPNHPLPFFMESQSQYIVRDFPSARKSLEKTLSLKPDYEDALKMQKIMFADGVQ